MGDAREMHRGNGWRRGGALDAPVSEGVASRAVDAEERDDLAGLGHRHLLHLVRVHAHQPRDLDLLATVDVHDHLALLDHALVHVSG